ncbi:MAG: hypothetical protein AAF800_14050, partial [Planctomycetota bacterium]
MLNSAMFGYSRSGGGSGPRAGGGASSRRTQREVQYLEDRFERLSLVCMAMWSLLQDKTDLTEADLLERVQTIDLMDGQADAKAGKA